MTLKTKDSIGIVAHRIEARPREINPGRPWGGVEAEISDDILSPLNCGKIKRLS